MKVGFAVLRGNTVGFSRPREGREGRERRKGEREGEREQESWRRFPCRFLEDEENKKKEKKGKKEIRDSRGERELVRDFEVKKWKLDGRRIVKETGEKERAKLSQTKIEKKGEGGGRELENL